ncbi:MAG TPA: hypothetical protein VKQ32_17590 [Polyangia bacterium]|nr:hypothetical protein [Polyangia bacterium]
MLFPGRLRFGLTISVLGLVAGCATGGAGNDAIRPRSGVTAADYYPLADGWKWAFDVEQDGTNILATYVVMERKGAISVVQAGDERLTYVVTPDGVAQFDGNAIGDYVIRNPIAPGAEWAVASGRARIASVNETVNIESVGRYAGCVVVEVTRTDPTRVTRTVFAPDLGPVALEMQVQDGTKFVTTARARLRAVTKPGDPLATP